MDILPIDISIHNDSSTIKIKKGTTLELSVTPDLHYRFLKWNDGDLSNPRTYVVTDDTVIKAILEKIPTYIIDLSVNDEAMGEVKGAGEYDENTEVSIEAVSKNIEDYFFEKWSDGDTNAVKTFTIKENINLTANFIAPYGEFKPVVHYSDLMKEDAQYIMAYINSDNDIYKVGCDLTSNSDTATTRYILAEDCSYDGTTVTDRLNGKIFYIKHNDDITTNCNQLVYADNKVLGVVDRESGNDSYLSKDTSDNITWTIWNNDTYGAYPTTDNSTDIFGVFGYKEFVELENEIKENTEYVAIYENDFKIMNASFNTDGYIKTKMATAILFTEDTNIKGIGFTNYLHFEKVQGTNYYHIYRKGIPYYKEDVSVNYYLGGTLIPSTTSNGSIYERVESIDQISIDSSVVFVYTGNNTGDSRIMAKEQSKNFSASDKLTLSDDFKELLDFDASIFNLCVSTKGYIIKDITKAKQPHLYASGRTSSNILTLSDDDTTGIWDISIDSNTYEAIVKDITNTSTSDPEKYRNYLQYNNSGTGLFSAYKQSAKKKITIYKKKSGSTYKHSFKETSTNTQLDDTYNWNISYGIIRNNQYVNITNVSTGYTMIYDVNKEAFDCKKDISTNIRLYKFLKSTVNDDSSLTPMNNIWWIANTEKYKLLNSEKETYLTYNIQIDSPTAHRFQIYRYKTIEQNGAKPVQLFYREKIK